MSLKMNATCLKFSLGLIFLLLLQQVSGQHNFSELDDYLSSHQKVLGTNAVAMIWKNDTLIYKKEMGEMNTRTKAPVASCSKWLTAALVMTFVDEGKISLDDKVSKYIPEFERYGKNYITIRHCLSHMTGIQSEPIKILKLLQRKKFKSLEEEVNAFAAKEIQTNPGTEFRYSTIGLNIAGRIVEIVGKRKFDMLMRQRIFVPLGMRGSTFSTLDGSSINPSGGAISTADDYMHFLVMLLNNGKYNGRQILSEQSVKEMRTVQTSLQLIKYAPEAAKGFNYALGSWVFSQDGKGQATALSSPGLFGGWPMVDYCHGYAYLFFVKNLLGEERAGIQMEIKNIIDRQFKDSCR
jgi:CubicO group peptidase (beta-lactamase class C family)